MSKEILDIIINPNPILRKKSVKINSEELQSADFQELVLSMIKTMQIKDGAGLSAPQISKNIRLIVINTKEGPLVMINPKLSKKSFIKEWDSEGCLSVLDKDGNIIYGDVKRHRKVTCKFTDQTGKERMIKAKGLMARVIQHEIDHLDGILFIDKAKHIKPYERN
ncbi:MAG: peptide deformylase [bacterium]